MHSKPRREKQNDRRGTKPGPLPNSFVSRIVCLAWGLISPSNYNDQCGEAQPEKGTFFTPQVYERVGISLVEENETVGRFFISVRNKANTTERCIMSVRESARENFLAFRFVHMKRQCIYSSSKGYKVLN